MRLYVYIHPHSALSHCSSTTRYRRVIRCCQLFSLVVSLVVCLSFFVSSPPPLSISLSFNNLHNKRVVIRRLSQNLTFANDDVELNEKKIFILRCHICSHNHCWASYFIIIIDSLVTHDRNEQI